MNDIDEKYKQYVEEGRIGFFTFHPSYSYEEFIEGLTIHTEQEGISTTDLHYVLKPGIFKTFCKRALLAAIGEDWQDDKESWASAYGKYNQKDSIDWDNAPKFVMIIDEINRGDMSKIFGELITLLEPDKRLGAKHEIIATLPLSNDSFSVPQNVYIVATMNTADRSIALLDIALRRRFGFVPMEPQLDLILDETKNDSLSEIDDENTMKLLKTSVNALKIINDRILQDRSLGKDKTIGHSFLFNISTKNEIDSAWQNDILPLLDEYCYDNESKKMKILFNDETKKIENMDSISLLDAITNAK